MFILYSILIGTMVGVLLGGDAHRLAKIELHWKPLFFAGFFFQVVLFSPFVAQRVGDLGPLLYVASTAVVLIAVVRNVRIAGLPIVVVGSLSNLAAIVANGGYMPAGAAAMAALGKHDPTTYSNSALLPHPILEPLTDIFALPAWLPFANVFSIGDVVIGVGVAWAIVAGMREHRTGEPGRTRNGSSAQLRTALGGAAAHLSFVSTGGGTTGPLAVWDSRSSVHLEDHKVQRWYSVQGKPVVRRGTQS